MLCTCCYYDVSAEFELHMTIYISVEDLSFYPCLAYIPWLHSIKWINCTIISIKRLALLRHPPNVFFIIPQYLSYLFLSKSSISQSAFNAINYRDVMLDSFFPGYIAPSLDRWRLLLRLRDFTVFTSVWNQNGYCVKKRMKKVAIFCVRCFSTSQ